MKRTVLFWLFSIFFILVSAETVILNNFKRYEGRLVGKVDNVIYLEMKNNKIKIPKSKIFQIKNNAGATITRITYKKKDFFKSNFSKNEFIWIKDLAKFEAELLIIHKQSHRRDIEQIESKEKPINPLTLLKSDFTTIKFIVNQSDVFVSLNESDLVLVKGNEVEIQLLKGEEHIVSFSKLNFKTKTEIVKSLSNKSFNVNLVNGKSDKKFNLPGYITVDANQKDAEIYINNIKMGTTPAQVHVTAGKHLVSIRKDLYHTYEREVNLAEKAIADMGIVKLKENFGYFTITSNPSGAIIHMEDKYIGLSPIRRTKMKSGTYKIMALSRLYHKKILNIEINDNDDIAFPIALDPAFGTIIVESVPENGATVYINDEQVGVTPFINYMCPSGEYLVSIEKEMWFGSEKTVTVIDNQTTKAILDMISNYGKVTIKSSQCNIYINDEFVGTDNIIKDLKAGEYVISAKRAYYSDELKNISIESGNNLTFDLIPKPKMASLSIMSKPFATKGAEIYLNKNKQKETTPAVFETIMGNYDITVKSPGYIDRTKNIFLKNGEQKEVEFVLIPYKNSSLYKAKKWKTRKWISMITGFTLVAGGTVFNSLEGDKWNEYSKTSYFFSVIPLTAFLISNVNEIYYKHKAKKE